MRTTPIDLSQLPPPEIIETLDYEDLLAERKAEFIGLFPVDKQPAIAAALELESDPLAKLLQHGTYRELLLRQLLNERSRAVLLAYARGKTLEHIGALFDVERLLILPANPETGADAVYEDDESLRERIQLAPRGFSVAGPGDAYVFHARNADGRVLSASCYSPAPCEIVVTILSREGDGTANQELLDIVQASLEKKRPLTDLVTVQSARIVRYAIRSTLRFFSGPDRAVALDEARRKTATFAAKMHRIGMEITVDGLHASQRVAGVQKVLLETPKSGVPVTAEEAPYCTAIELLDGGVADEA
jgi:phage-related baseplate assembly protein